MCFERLVNIQRNPCTRYVVTTYIISTYFVRTPPEELYLSRQIYRYLVNHVHLYLMCTFSVFPFPPFWDAYLHDIYSYGNGICRYETSLKSLRLRDLLTFGYLWLPLVNFGYLWLPLVTFPSLTEPF